MEFTYFHRKYVDRHKNIDNLKRRTYACIGKNQLLDLKERNEIFFLKKKFAMNKSYHKKDFSLVSMYFLRLLFCSRQQRRMNEEKTTDFFLLLSHDDYLTDDYDLKWLKTDDEHVSDGIDDYKFHRQFNSQPFKSERR